MATLVGTQDNFLDAVYKLIELDYDAIEAYNVAIEKFNSQHFKDKFEEFKKDHQRHVDQLTQALKRDNHKFPEEPDAKGILTKGKVYLGKMIGMSETGEDDGILKAMLDNENDTNTAYENMLKHKDLNGDYRTIISSGFDDEKRHKEWIENEIENLKK